MHDIKSPEDFVVLPLSTNGYASRYFIKAKVFHVVGSKDNVKHQWWLYGLNDDGMYEAIVGTNEQDIEEAKKMFYEE